MGTGEKASIREQQFDRQKTSQDRYHSNTPYWFTIPAIFARSLELMG